MSRKIKLHTFNALFQLFDYLADRTGGWRVFVRPKMLLGSLIVGLGLTSCGTKTENKTKAAIQPSKHSNLFYQNLLSAPYQFLFHSGQSNVPNPILQINTDYPKQTL